MYCIVVAGGRERSTEGIQTGYVMTIVPANITPPNDRLVVGDLESAIYQNGTYLEHNPSWHAEESPFKIRQIRKMIERQHLVPKTVCDVGCGVGMVLAGLQQYMPP